MARSIKTSPPWQLALVFLFYIIFFILYAFAYMFILRYYGIDTLKNANGADPNVRMAWKSLLMLESLCCNLLPAFLFTWIVSSRPIAWLQADKLIRWRPALFVAVIVLLGYPVAWFLYNWNCTFSFAQSSVKDIGEMAVTARMVEQMPHVGYLFFNLAVFVLLPAITKEIFFRGVLQKVVINLAPRAPWLGIGISSALFAVSFFQWQYLFLVMFWGVVFGTIYYLTENLWLPILGHFLHRAIGMVHSYLFQHHLTSEDPYFPSDMPWYLAFISLLSMGGVVWYYRKSIPRPVMKVAYQDDIDSIGRS